jgi:hypothetical protein
MIAIFGISYDEIKLFQHLRFSLAAQVFDLFDANLNI